MKKLVLLLAAVLMTAAIPLPAFAEEPQPEQPSETQAPRVEDLYTYTVNTAGNAEIQEFKAKDTYEGEVIIPEHLDGYPVGYIENMAFANAKKITSVTIPANVFDMGNAVFFGCESLQTIHVAEGNPYLKEIDSGVLVADEGKYLVAYPAAKAGDTYTIPDTVDEISPSCFSYAKNLKNITIPPKVQYIDSYAFAYSSLEQVNISSQSIDEHAFAYCSNLHDVTLNNGIEQINGGAFGACTSLTEIHFPDSLRYIGQLAFCGTGMTSVTIPATVTEIDYCAFGYDENQHTVSGFTIYGETGSAAEEYASASDPEYDYENHFNFVAVTPTEEQTEAPHETETQQFITETNADGEIITELVTDFTPEEMTDADWKTPVSAELQNNFVKILLATVGGIAVVLALTFIILSAKKPKKKKQQDDET